MTCQDFKINKTYRVCFYIDYVSIIHNDSNE